MMKKLSLLVSVAILSFVLTYSILAWAEPATTPPQDNVPAPINVGTITQDKMGVIGAFQFRDAQDPSYYLDPAGDSVFGGNLTVEGNIYGKVCEKVNYQMKQISASYSYTYCPLDYYAVGIGAETGAEMGYTMWKTTKTVLGFEGLPETGFIICCPAY